MSLREGGRERERESCPAICNLHAIKLHRNRHSHQSMAGYSPPWVQRAPPYGTYAEPQRITTLHVTDGFSPPAPAHSTAELGIPYRHRRAPGMRSVCTCCQVQDEQCRYPPAPCLRFHTSISIISYRLLGWSGRRVTRDHFLLNGTGEKCRPGTQILCVSR